MNTLIRSVSFLSVLLLATAAFAAPQAMTREEIVSLAQSGVNYSYYWGHGSWRTDGAQHGSCSGSCPNCTHSGSYGADCSGYVAKVWQVPSPSPVSTNSHPYSTANFRWESTHWEQISRGSAKKADAFVYRNSSNTGGHIVLFESGDPWGQSWAYEAKGCSYGIVHNLRTFSSSYVVIQRDNLNTGPQTGTLIGSVYVDRGQGAADMSERIPGARVEASGQTATARADDAIWSMDLPVGDHRATASASGYSDASRTCAVVAGQQTWCSIGLAPVCTPDCAGKSCGPDGCGGSCGSCGADHVCTASGQCECQPDCSGLACGPDPICGQSCGGCGEDEACEGGQCECQPACAGLACGPDPVCGQDCGSCAEGLVCTEGSCVEPACEPLCTGRTCGLDPICGLPCGACGEDEVCDEAGQCRAAGCQPACASRSCGPDPDCGRSCGVCPADRLCSADGLCDRIDPDRGKLYGVIRQAATTMAQDDTRTDGSANPGPAIPAAEIHLPDGTLLLADENGYWEAQLAPGSHRISARAPGYLPAEARCEVEGGGHTDCALSLTPGSTADDDDFVVKGGCATAPGAPAGPLGFLLLGLAGLLRRRAKRARGQR